MEKINEKKDWNVVEWSSPIVEATQKNNGRRDDLIIKGVAITETTSRNGITYVAEELEKAGPTWTGKPMLLDHQALIDNIVGRVNKSEYKSFNKAIHYEARIVDEDIKSKIKNGVITDVSIGAKVKDIVKDKKSGTLTAVGIEGLEISFVAVPGIVDQHFTSIGEAFQNSFEKRQAKHNNLVKKKELNEDMKTAEKLLAGYKLNLRIK